MKPELTETEIEAEVADSDEWMQRPLHPVTAALLVLATGIIFGVGIALLLNLSA